MVVFQPQKVTPNHLGSVTIVTLKLSLSPHIFLPFVWIFLLPPTAYRCPTCSRSSSKSSLLFTRSPFTLLEQSAAYLDVTRNRHPSVSAARICAPHHVPVSTVTTVTIPPTPPFSAFNLLPGTCRPLGVCPSRVPMRLCAPASPSPIYPPNPGIFQSLVSCRVNFYGRVIGQDTSNIWQLLDLALAPPATCP